MSMEQVTAIQRVTRNKLAIRERQKTALELRLAGETFQSIADKLGYKSKHGSFRAVETALAEITRQPAESLREMELQRLDAMFAGFWPGAQQGDPVAVGGCLKIMERRAKLLELDGPSKPTGGVSEFDGVSDAELEAWIAERCENCPKMIIVRTDLDVDKVVGRPPLKANELSAPATATPSATAQP